MITKRGIEMKKVFALLLASLMLCLTACGSGDNTAATTATPTDITETTVPVVREGFDFTKENYPKMGGSLAALPLGEAITATVLGISRDDAGGMIVFEGSTTDNYVALVDGEFDILLAYEPSADALAYAKSKGVELEMTAIGADALAFICSTENNVNSLTETQIKQIYSGQITQWNEVGGTGGEIIAYQRNKDSGSQTLFDKLLNLGDDLVTPPVEQQISSMIGLLEAVANYDNSKDALGYTVYYYLTNMEKDKLETTKILAVNGIAPTNETIASGEYPYVNDFYVVIPKGLPDDAPAKILYDWICSEQCEQLIENENYVAR